MPKKNVTLELECLLKKLRAQGFYSPFIMKSGIDQFSPSYENVNLSKTDVFS